MRVRSTAPSLSETASNCQPIDAGKLTDRQREVLLGMAEDGGPLPICEIKRRFNMIHWRGTIHPLVRRAYLKKTQFCEIYQITSRGRARAKKEAECLDGY